MIAAFSEGMVKKSSADIGISSVVIEAIKASQKITLNGFIDSCKCLEKYCQMLIFNPKNTF